MHMLGNKQIASSYKYYYNFYTYILLVFGDPNIEVHLTNAFSISSQIILNIDFLWWKL